MFFFEITYVFYIMGVDHCASHFMCIRFIKGNFKFNWPYRASCFAPCSYVRYEKSNAIWVLSAFCTPILLFYEGACSFAPIIFKGLFIKKTLSLRSWCRQYFYPPRWDHPWSSLGSQFDSNSVLHLTLENIFLISIYWWFISIFPLIFWQTDGGLWWWWWWWMVDKKVLWFCSKFFGIKLTTKKCAQFSSFVTSLFLFEKKSDFKFEISDFWFKIL